MNERERMMELSDEQLDAVSGGAETPVSQDDFDSFRIWFAKVQLELSQQARSDAMAHILEMQASQAAQKEISDRINELWRTLPFEEASIAVAIEKEKLDALTADTQRKMVFVQDYMGQYSSYLEGANSAIQKANQTAQGLARER